MVAILENGRHFEILRGTRYFLNEGLKRDYLLIALSRRRRKAIHVSFACAIPQRI